MVFSMHICLRSLLNHPKRVSKITLHHHLTNLRVELGYRRSSISAGSPLLLKNLATIFLIAARFQVPIYVRCTPYFFDNSATVISSRIASSATLASKSGEWFFRFVILDHLSHKLIHLNYWSEFPRPPLTTPYLPPPKKYRGQDRHTKLH
jgi:hypothetical protein